MTAPRRTARQIAASVRPPAPPTRRLRLNWAVIEQRRIAAGLTRDQLATRIGITPYTGSYRL